MGIHLIPDKDIKKAREELVDLHRRCLLNYLIQQDVSYKGRKRFFALYDRYISHRNILEYFHKPLKLFVYALVTDRLDEIRSFKKATKKTIRQYKKKASKYV